METNKNQNPASEKPDAKTEAIRKITENLLAKASKPQAKPAEKEQPKTGELKGVENPKQYTSGDLWMYGGIGALITGIIGYFIGQSQGKKKSEAEHERIMQEYREKMEKRLSERQQLNGRKEKKEKTKPVFRME